MHWHQACRNTIPPWNLQPARKGDPEMPLTGHELATPVIGAAKANSLLAACWAINRHKDMDVDFSLVR